MIARWTSSGDAAAAAAARKGGAELRLGRKWRRDGNPREHSYSAAGVRSEFAETPLRSFF